MHGLIFELKERMNSRQDQPVKKTKQSLVKVTERNLQKNNTLLKCHSRREVTQQEVCMNERERERMSMSQYEASLKTVHIVVSFNFPREEELLQ